MVQEELDIGGLVGRAKRDCEYEKIYAAEIFHFCRFHAKEYIYNIPTRDERKRSRESVWWLLTIYLDILMEVWTWCILLVAGEEIGKEEREKGVDGWLERASKVGEAELPRARMSTKKD